ncbi:MAG: Spy/CpxP family protein refolding chaperone [Melioribacteraceae bacterium]|nr:Spy/CpxP family protein refolding chaperone [Melioribacteraceae bacterium]
MSRKKIIIGGSIVTLLLVGLIATGCKHRACHFNKSPEEKIEYFVEHVSDELDLTEQQEAKVKNLAEEVHSKIENQKSTTHEVYSTLLGEIKNSSVDKEKLSSVIDNKMNNINEMKPFFIDKFTEFHQILTPEQRNELAEKMEKLHKRMGH